MATGNDIRYLPCYTIKEAAIYLKIPVSTLRSWVCGQPNFRPLITLPQGKSPSLSFINLVEAYVLAAIRRKYHIPMQKVRRALNYIRREFSSTHPLAEQRFETDGLNLFLRKSGMPISVTQEGQMAIREVINRYLSRIEHDNVGLAEKLYPFTRTGDPEQPKLVIIDPKISFGRPILVSKGIPIAVIAERLQAGESMDDLMADYELRKEEVEEAIRCELGYRQAA